MGGTVTSVAGSTPTVTGASNTAETATLSSLTPNTEYYFQIEATNSVGTTYGAVLNFTTTLAPTATTSAARTMIDRQAGRMRRIRTGS